MMTWLSTWLSFLLVLQLWPTSLAAQPIPPPQKLNIVVVEGEGGINNIRQHTAQALAVRVEDENKRPVGGAIVVFMLPSQGASGTFSNGAKTLAATADDQGRAAARDLKPNSVLGQMDIRVNASYQGRTARANITQFNMAVPTAKGGSGKLIVILAVVGAAAAGGAYAGLHKGGSNSASGTAPSPPPPIGITPGAGTVGPPQ